MVGVGVRLAMQLAMKASHAPLRCGRVACCACLKQKSSISLGAAEAGFMLVNARKVTATNTHFGFKVLAPPLNLTTISDLYKTRRAGGACWKGQSTVRSCFSLEAAVSPPVAADCGKTSLTVWSRFCNCVTNSYVSFR